MVWESSYWGTPRHYAIEAESGRYRAATQSEAAIDRPITGTYTVAFDSLGRLVLVDGSSESPAPVGEHLGLRNAVAFDSDYLVASTNKRKLLLFELTTLEELDSIGPLPGHPRLTFLPGSGCVWCSCTLPGGTVQHMLLAVEDRKLKQHALWSSGSHRAQQNALPAQVFSLKPKPDLRVLSPVIVERRDLKGQIVDEIVLPSKFESCYPRIEIFADIVWAHNTSLGKSYFFDLSAKQDLAFPAGAQRRVVVANETHVILSTENEYPERSMGGPTRLISRTWPSGSRNLFLSVYDRKSQTLKSIMDLGCNFSLTSINSPPNRILLQSGSNGVSLFVLDSNRVVAKKWSPFAWATWLLPATVIAFALWAAFWIRASLRDSGSPWLDALLLCSLPFATIFLRANAVEPLHLTLNLCQGILLGALVCSGTWVAMGSTRLAWRLLPFLAVASLLSVVLLWYLGVTNLAIEGLLTTLLPATGFVMAAALLRIMGMRVVNRRTALTPQGESRVAMLDYFVIMLGVAVFLAPFSRFVSQIDFVAMVGNIWLPLLISSLSLCVWVSLVLSPSQVAFRFSIIVAIVFAALLLYIPWHHFAFGFYPTNYYAARSILAVLGLAIVVIFATLLPFRLRGWRLGFKSPHQPATTAQVSRLGDSPG